VLQQPPRSRNILLFQQLQGFLERVEVAATWQRTMPPLPSCGRRCGCCCGGGVGAVCVTAAAAGAGGQLVEQLLVLLGGGGQAQQQHKQGDRSGTYMLLWV
jgi:hypothetical protein